MIAYPIRYARIQNMNVIERARRTAGLSIQALADLAQTSRPTVSAYIHGRKIPRLDTAERILDAAGHDLELRSRLRFIPIDDGGRTYWVPNTLWRLMPHEAVATLSLPFHLQWSGNRPYKMSDRYDRARVYETVLRDGTPTDIERRIDGALLIDLWDELVVPRAVRRAWQKLIDRALSETRRD